MMKFWMMVFVLGSYADDLTALVQNSNKAANTYKDDAQTLIEQSTKTAESYLNDAKLVKQQAQQRADQYRNNSKNLDQKQNTGNSTKPCHRCNQTKALTQSNQALAPLKIFVSSSMPKQSLKALYQQASKIGARLVFRGLINNSFKDTQRFFTDLSIAGEIDPPAFEQFKVTVVPTFILTHDQKYDAIQGNISLNEALSQFAEKGELKEDAIKLKAPLGAHS